jgi:hypothetical protein
VNPKTTATITQGRLLRVRCAPPPTSPLCCRIRRSGSTVNPTYVWCFHRWFSDVRRYVQKTIRTAFFFRARTQTCNDVIDFSFVDLKKKLSCQKTATR